MLPSVLTPQNASLNDLEAGLGLKQLGEGPSRELHGKSKSDGTQFLVYNKQLLQKKKMFWAEIGAIRSNNGLNVLFSGTALYSLTP